MRELGEERQGLATGRRKKEEKKKTSSVEIKDEGSKENVSKTSMSPTSFRVFTQQGGGNFLLRCLSDSPSARHHAQCVTPVKPSPTARRLLGSKSHASVYSLGTDSRSRSYELGTEPALGQRREGPRSPLAAIGHQAS